MTEGPTAPGATGWRRWARVRASRPAVAPGPARPTAAPSLASLLLCALLGTALGGAVAGDSRPALTPDSTTTATATTATTRIRPTGCQLDCPPTPTRTAVRSPTGPPTRVRIPRIRVDSTLARLRLDRTGRLAAPTDFAEAGWYAGGTAPGDVGPAVIAGHVDSEAGPAVFHRLSELRPGDRIEVRRDTGWIPFRVTGLSRHAKDDFPTAAVYGPTPGPELRLITCDGVFHRPTGHYLDNLVVFAVADLPVVIPSSAAG
ncbi:class F sortase [Plantactinospora solaniradicis]|uniref:Class F sortase n=1 Tax=Plantactinospora solaniradicis TaxID=1723736 RepID=A0ABW1KI77_9ACTN